MSFALRFRILLIVVNFFPIDMNALIHFIRRLSPLPDEQDMLLMDKPTSIAGVILVVNGLFCILQGVLGGLFSPFSESRPRFSGDLSWVSSPSSRF